MPFNLWFVHTPPSGHINGISGDCVNREKSSGSTCSYGQVAPLSHIGYVSFSGVEPGQGGVGAATTPSLLVQKYFKNSPQIDLIPHPPPLHSTTFLKS